MEFDSGSLLAAVIGGILTAGASFAVHWLQGRRSAKAARLVDENSVWQENAKEHKELRADIRNVEGVVREIKGQVEILIGIVTRKG